jgi:hypothetical protein
MQRGRYIYRAALAGALALVGWAGRPAFAAAPTASGLPTGFNAAALGSPTETQSISVDASGAWTIQAGGDGLNDSSGADAGVGAYQKLSGNGSIIAHIASVSDPGAQAAVVFRADPTDASSAVLRLKSSGANQLEAEIRRTSGDTPQAASSNNDSSMVGFRGFNGTGGDTVPSTGIMLSKSPWIGMDRDGNKFGFYASNDGKVWKLIATAVDSQSVYPADMQVGIEASKNTASAAATIKLDGVAVSPSLLAPAAISGVSYLPRDKSVIVTWNAAAVTGADVTYNVYSFNTPNASDSPKKVNTAPIKDSSLLVENLTNGTQYRFGVTAVVNNVESPLALPLPSVLSAGGIGMAIPNPPVEGGLQLYTFGTNDPGTVSVTGTGAAAVYQFKVGGADFWESGDGGSMLAMPMAGDLDVSLRLVQGPTDNGDGWAQGGPTFRETLDPGSRMVIAVLSAANTMQFKRRLVENARPTNSDIAQSSGDNTTRPVWGRLVAKTTNDVTSVIGYIAEGANTPKAADWKPMGDPASEDSGGGDLAKFKNFSKMPYVGMCWTSHKEGSSADVTVDNFVIKPAQ